MACESHWTVGGAPVDPESEERTFFDEHEWETIDAASARIFPTDHQPGAREARVVRFIDRYLSVIDYIYAAADGSGFLRLDGRLARAWEERIAALQQIYRDGIRRLDELSLERFGAEFKQATDGQQDEVLEVLAEAAKPVELAAGRAQAYGSTLQSVSDHNLDFFNALALHTRQGFYGDPIYGGNKDRVGWDVIGFPGPKSLADTNDCSYSVKEYLVTDRPWEDLIPYMREKAQP
jgi:gluconate 2-dehydrogenase gamma chain